MLSCSNDGKALLWNLNSKESQVLYESEGKIFCMDLTRDGKALGLAGDSQKIQIFDLKYNSERFAELNTEIDVDSEILDIKFSENSNFLITGDSNGLLNLYSFGN